MDFMGYMPDDCQYGDPTDPADVDIGGYGWQIGYISSTFLNGWINYVTPILAFTLSRYTTREELAAKVAAFETDPPFHTKLDWFGDDVLMLCKERQLQPEGQGYWYFWFDMDCSDCSIGRFMTTDSEETVLNSFEAWVRERTVGGFGEGGDGAMFKLDTKHLKGWLSF